VVPDAELPARAAALAQDMAATSRTSNSTVKKLLLDTYRTGLEEQMELEGRYIKDSAQSADGQEGIAAFVAKRAPVFG
jgi:2-(1,2-epoxy-1,2-dihydrophenyl)acetyl-CoA isomerase